MSGERHQLRNLFARRWPKGEPVRLDDGTRWGTRMPDGTITVGDGFKYTPYACIWTDDAKTELHLLSMNLHDLSVEATRTSPTIALIVEGYAKRIDELMKRAPK